MTPKSRATLAARAALDGIAVEFTDGLGGIVRLTARRGFAVVRYLRLSGEPPLRLSGDTPDTKALAEQFERIYALSTHGTG